MLESAVGPRTTVQSPLRWTEDGDWKHDYNNLARMPPEEIAKRRAEFDKVKQVALSAAQAGGQWPGMTASMSKPFAGVKILDFTRVLAGPYGSYQLALLGADVIKVESREGDDMRFGNRANDWEKRGLAAPWVAVNAGKRSITSTSSSPRRSRSIKRLVPKADVVMENFRPGVMDKLGIGYETLKAINPRLIYCAVSGFGQVGPDKATAAFDGMIQAMSGPDVDHRLPVQRPDARGLRRRRRDVGLHGGASASPRRSTSAPTPARASSSTSP